MTVSEGKEKFIKSWGALGTDWGISRTMAQIHALLLISPDPLCADDVIRRTERVFYCRKGHVGNCQENHHPA